MRGRGGSAAASWQVSLWSRTSHSSYSSPSSPIDFLVIPRFPPCVPRPDHRQPRAKLFAQNHIRHSFCLSRLLRSRFLLTLLGASVIHPSVSIAYCGLHRMVNNGSGSDSVVDSCFALPPTLTFIGSRSLPLESINHQTQYPPSPLSCTITLPSVFNQLYILTASRVYLIMHRLTLI